MRLRIASDLHFEQYPDYGAKSIEQLAYRGEEALVLAGDIFRLDKKYKERTTAALGKLAAIWPRIIYVPGNHEFWDCSPGEAYDALRDLVKTYPNFTFLQSGSIFEFGGRRFLGDTMWFPANPNNWKFQRQMPDFRKTTGLDPWAYQRNADFRAFLDQHLKAGDVVITHHLPTFKSVHPDYHNSQINRFFVSDMNALMYKHSPALWVHGHTHHQFDYQVHNTRVLCNPRGSPGELTQKDWDPDLIVEL